MEIDYPRAEQVFKEHFGHYPNEQELNNFVESGLKTLWEQDYDL